MFGRKEFRRPMLLLCALFAPLMATTSAAAQADLADMREDVRGLSQRVNELSLRIEQLEHDNEQLRAKAAGAGNKDLVTTAQLNGAVADLNASIHSAVATSRTEILEKVAVQMENLAKQTNSALDSIAKPAPVPQPHAAVAASTKPVTFGDSFPKEGTTYTVAKGDSLGGIARKTGAKAQDIIDANKLTDPSRIQVGQVLIIPGGK